MKLGFVAGSSSKSLINSQSFPLPFPIGKENKGWFKFLGFEFLEILKEILRAEIKYVENFQDPYSILYNMEYWIC